MGVDVLVLVFSSYVWPNDGPFPDLYREMPNLNRLRTSIELDIHHRHGRNHLDLGQIIEHFEQRLARVDEPMPSEFAGFIGTLSMNVVSAHRKKIKFECDDGADF